MKYWLWLSTHFSPLVCARLVEYFGTPEQAWYADQEEWELLDWLTPKARQGAMDKDLDGADRILSRCDQLGLRLVTWADAAYPHRLREIDGAPVVLYVRGKLFSFDDEIAIGVVGTRKPSEYGRRMAGKLGLDLARNGALMVSGMAQGLDEEAIKGALKGGGPVVSVLPTGIDVVYPKVHRFLYEDVAAAGALMSECPPGTTVGPNSFYLRNRILSGLCLGVAAVECEEYSGTMITVRHALDQGRDVFAVPGNADAPMSAGTNRLIQEGAGLVTCGWDIIREYADRFPGKVKLPAYLTPEEQAQRLEAAPGPAPDQGTEPPPKDPKGPVKVPQGPKSADPPPEPELTKPPLSLTDPKVSLTDDQKDILAALGNKRRLSDDLIEETQIPARRVLSALTILQVQGLVQEGPGKRFEALVTVEP